MTWADMNYYKISKALHFQVAKTFSNRLFARCISDGSRDEDELDVD
jgi:hypothetical protein